MIKLLFYEMRPRQWLKNTILLLPATFANQIFKIDILEKLIIGFLIFSLTASGLYIINDIVDYQKDRLHPEKKNRPIASGGLSFAVAGLIAVIFIASSLISSYFIGLNFFKSLLAYIALILIYSFYLKRIPILDMVAIAVGFVLRVVAGAFLILVAPSNWIIVTTFFFALFFVATKRRLELGMLVDEAKNHRAVLDQYNETFLNIILGVTSTMAIACYSIYTFEESVVTRLGTGALIYTVPFVFIMVTRMIFIAVGDKFIKTSDPTNIVTKDAIIYLSAICWLISVLIIISFGHV